MNYVREEKEEYLESPEETKPEIRHRDPVREVGFAAIDHVFTLDQRISDGAYRTYATMYYFWKNNKDMWASTTTLAGLRGLKESTIRQHVRELIDLKLVSRELRLGRSSIIYIENPPVESVDLAVEILKSQSIAKQRKNQPQAMPKQLLTSSQNTQLKDKQERETKKEESGDAKTASPSPLQATPADHGGGEIDFPIPAPRERLTAHEWKLRLAQAAQEGMENARTGEKAAVASPVEAKKQYVKQVSLSLEKVLHPDSTAALQDTMSAARKAFEWGLPVPDVIRYCNMAQGEGGEQFRKPGLTGGAPNAYWVIRAIQRWIVDGKPELCSCDNKEEASRRTMQGFIESHRRESVFNE